MFVDNSVTQYYVYLHSSFCAFVNDKLRQGAVGIPICLVFLFNRMHDCQLSAKC